MKQNSNIYSFVSLEVNITRALQLLERSGVLRGLGRAATGYNVPGVKSAMAYYLGTTSHVEDLWRDAEELLDVETLTNILLRDFDQHGLEGPEKYRYVQLVTCFLGEYSAGLHFCRSTV